MNPKSHVNFLTADGERKTLSAEELSRIRLELLTPPK
jgi:hypothetical protein